MNAVQIKVGSAPGEKQGQPVGIIVRNCVAPKLRLVHSNARLPKHVLLQPAFGLRRVG